MSEPGTPGNGIMAWRISRVEDDIREMRPTAEKVERMTTDIAILESRVQASIQAVAKAEGSMDKRLETMNEFRQSLTDQSNLYASKETVDAQRDATLREARLTTQRITELEVRIAKTESRSAAYAIAIAVFLSIITVAVRFL